MATTLGHHIDGHRSAEPPEPAAAAPPSGRLVGIDIARAVALLGMFTQHVHLEGDGSEFSTGWVAFVFREAAGRASVLFFVLSGVSLSIIAAKGSASAGSTALVRRGFLLLAGGLLLTETIWSASILQHYGVAFLAAPLLLRLGRRGLATVTGVGLVGGPILLLFAPNWTDDLIGPLDGASSRWLVGSVWDIAVSGIYPMVLWIGFFTLGMLIGRLDLADRRLLVRLAAGAIVIALGVGLAASAATERFGRPDGFDESAFDDGAFEDGAFDDGAFEDGAGEDGAAGESEELDESKKLDAFDGFESGDEFAGFGDVPPDGRALLDVAGHSGGMGWTLQTGSMAVAALAGALLLPGSVTGRLRPLAWMGSMSLTAYVVHIVLVTDVAGPYLEESEWSIVTRELFFAGLLVALITICSILHRLFGVGPLEWLLKQFTVGPGDARVSARP